MKPLTLLLLLATPLAAPQPLVADEFAAGNLVIHDPFAYETAPMALAGGGYLRIENRGDRPDRLIAVEAPPLTAEIHESYSDGGMHRMRKIAALEIPAHDSLDLAPGGYHVMFLGIGDDRLEAGESLPAVLVFETAGRVAVTFEVVPRPGAGGMPGMGHGGHGGQGN